MKTYMSEWEMRSNHVSPEGVCSSTRNWLLYILQPYLTFTAPINQQISHYKGKESNLRIRKTKMKRSFHGSSLLSRSVCIKRSRNLVWRHFWANCCTDLLRIASLTLSSWPHAPLYHTPLFFLPVCHLTFLLFTTDHDCVGLTQDRVSFWLRAIKYLAKCNRGLAKNFFFNSCHWLNSEAPSWIIHQCTLLPLVIDPQRFFFLLDIDFQPKMALGIVHTSADLFWFNFCLRFMLFSFGQLSKENLIALKLFTCE